MGVHRFAELVDLEQIRQLLEQHHRLSGLTYGLLDAEENVLIAVGWQEVCLHFHRVHPVTLARCRESDGSVRKAHPDLGGEFLEYRCQNGMTDVAIPIVIEGSHLASLLVGQFFYKDQPPDLLAFRRQAEEFGFESEAYLDALGRVPLFSREQVRSNLLFLHKMMQVLAETGVKSLRILRQTELRREAEATLAMTGFTLDQVHEAAYLIDAHGRFRYVNQEACRMLGYSREELLGMGIPGIDPDFQCEATRLGIEKLQGEGVSTCETRHRTKQGKIIPVEVTSKSFQHGGELFVLSMVRDVTERKRATETLLDQQRRLTRLAVELSLAEERERRRIAAELHDHLGQLLLLGKRKLNELLLGLPAPDQNAVEDVLEIQNQAIRSVRSLTQQLFPPILTDAGLVPALEWLGERIGEDYALRITVVDDGVLKPIPDELAGTVFQAVREFLINVAKHAETDSATVRLRRERDVVSITVEDCGKGTSLAPDEGDLPASGFGLFNIRERIRHLGGELSFRSSPGKGTRVTLRVPLVSVRHSRSGALRTTAV